MALESLLALLILNELLRKRTETECSFHQRVYLGYQIQGTVRLRPDLELNNRTCQEKRGKREEGLTLDNLLLYLVNKLTTNLICFGSLREGLRLG